MARTRKSASALFDAITLEGNLITPAMLARITAHEAGAQSEVDYNIPKGLTLRDEIARYFRIGQALFKELFSSATPSTGATTKFVEALLRDVFGFSDVRRVGSRTLGDWTFPVTMEGLQGRVPVVVVPPSDELDRASTHLHTEGRRRSAASSVQDWLNASEDALWGFCCNGERLRLVRDNASLTRPAFVEVNLRQLFEAEDFADFAAVWLLLHVTRFGSPGAPVADCTLERWREAGSKEGESARERLRDGVEAALLALGNGFLSHPNNTDLRERIVNNQLPLQDFFGQLLRLVYRMIFLLAAEDRGLLHPPGVAASVRKLYAEGYSLGALRDCAVRRSSWDRFHDRWEGLLITFGALVRGQPQLGLPALGGIFDSGVISDLEKVHISNRSLMEAIYRLAWLKDSATLMPVNWRDMETEELGSVYEGLLELTPRLMDHGRSFAFAEGTETKGNERKKTGSYYTPDSLVQALLDSALDPVLDRVESEAEDAASALLSVTVIDPACGSGHFLLATARRIATRVAHARAEGVASAEDYRHALRDVARSCIHGVDRNPMAVELTKVALWIETVEPGKPLGFLDANIRCGDSLLGIYNLEVLREGIPDAAYEPLSGDDKVIARDFEKRNKAQREGQATLFGGRHGLPAAPPLAGAARKLRSLPEETAEQIAEKRRQFTAASRELQRFCWQQGADAYIAAFLVPKTRREAPGSADSSTIPTTEDIFHFISGEHVVYGPRRGRIEQLAAAARPFHWPLEFPDIMERGGFDVVLGNPPWERIKIQEQEFFASREPEIAEAPNAAARGRLIHRLRQSAEGTRERLLFEEFETAKRIAEASSEFARLNEETGGRFSLTGHGDVNTYALFAELFNRLRRLSGSAGVIIPTGIAFDTTNRTFFNAIIRGQELRSLISFYEVRQWFPDTDDRKPFCLLSVGTGCVSPRFIFDVKEMGDLLIPDRWIFLTPEIISLVNPKTRTAPVFLSRADAELTRRLYSAVPPFLSNGASWNYEFFAMFHMANASHLFVTREDLTQKNLKPEDYAPLIEAKMAHIFDHRWNTYDQKGGLRLSSHDEHANPAYENEPRYWVSKAEIEARLKGRQWTRGWLMGWRDIVGSEGRTLIPAIVPRYAVNDKLLLLLPRCPSKAAAALYACLASMTCDYLAKQKVGGSSLKNYVIEQLPVLPEGAFNEEDLEFISQRVLELVYTSHSMAPFAHDLGYDGPPFAWDEDRRALLRSELDAWYARAYGLTRDDLRYILDPADVKGEDYPSETFRVLKTNEIKRFGEYRTARLVLDAWDRMQQGVPFEVSPTPEIGVASQAVLANLSSLPDGAWAASSNSADATLAQLAALIKVLPGATPIARVRLAALYAMEPRYLTQRLKQEDRVIWCRLVGSAAMPVMGVNIAAFAPKIDANWRDAVTQLRGMGAIFEDSQNQAWARGTAVEKFNTDGWPDGRAAFVFKALQTLTMEEALTDLVPADRSWIHAYAA